MKKFKYLLLIAIISFFVLPSSISAGWGFMRTTTVVTKITGIEPMYIKHNNLERNNIYMFEVISSGGIISRNDGLLEFDSDIFELTQFNSNYGFTYENGTIKYNGEEKEEYFVIEDEGDITQIWSFRLKVKEDAKCGVTEVNGYEYNIKCEDKSNNIVEEENKNDDMIENNNPTQEDYNNKENDNNNAVQKPEVNDNNQEINQEDNKIEANNNTTDKVILDDTKFYVLAGLLGTVVIEMFVLILKKTKKV